jgi:hypothetical protein
VYNERMVANRWGGRGRYAEPDRLSVLEIVRSGTLDLRLASLLWLIMGFRASVLVAAGPSFAGKTTTLNVLLDFLPPLVKEVRLRGEGEDFAFLDGAKPSRTYLVAEEFSDYGDYIWGDVAQRAFDLLGEGYSLGGTIHARTAREVVLMLNEYLGLPAVTIARVGVVVTLHATRGRLYGSQPVRRISTVSLVTPTDHGIALQTIAAGGQGSDAFVLADEKTLQAALAEKFSLGQLNVADEMDLREAVLKTLTTEGKLSRDEVRQSVVAFYESRSR